MNKILEQDFKFIFEAGIDYSEFENKCIFITGATGLVGSLICHFFLFLKYEKNINVQIIINVRNTKKAIDLFGERDYKVIESDIMNIPKFVDINIDFIYHCAAVTTSKLMVDCPVDVTQSIINGTQSVLEFSRNHNLKSFVYLSSMEVYGIVESNYDNITEDNLGKLDIINVRNCYPLGKRMAENICFSYFKQYGIPVKIARLVQVAGCGIDKNDSRVIMQFINSCLDQKDIILHTKGESYTNICYTADVVHALIFLSLLGENGQVYNVANEDNYITIHELANLVIKQFGNKNTLKFDIKDEYIKMYSSTNKNHISAEKIKKLGWQSNYNMEMILENMYKYFKSEYGD